MLVLQLNPSIPLRPGTVGALVLPILLLHGTFVALLFYAALLVRHLLAETVLSPGWVSFQLLVWLCLIAAGVAAALMWLNLSGLRVTLEDDAARRMALGAVVLTLGVALLLGLGVFRFSFGRGGRAGPAVFGMVVFASFALPLWLRGSAAGDARRAAPGRWRVVVRRVPARARHDAAAGWGVARLHLSGGGRRRPAERRPHPRGRCGDAPGDTPAYAARAGAHGNRHGQASAAHRRAIRGAVPSAARRPYPGIAA